MSELIISVSGLRGIVGASLTERVAADYALAFASHLPEGPLVVTRDGRANGPPLADAIAEALTAAGRGILDAGIAATPTTGILVRESGAAGGHSDFGEPQSGRVQRDQTLWGRGACRAGRLW